MRKKYVFAIAAVLLVSIVLAGCSQAASSAGNQTPTAVQGISELKPVSAAASDNRIGNAPVAAENSSSSVSTVKTEPQPVKIGDILVNPKEYEGKNVVVQGKIASECPSGCWFTLKDGNAVIYIDLNPNNMVIPQKKGSSAKVTALVVREGSDVYLIGSKVEF